MNTKLGFIYFSYWRMDLDIFFQLSKRHLHNVVYLDLRDIFPELKTNEINHPFSEGKLPIKPLKFDSIAKFNKYLKNESIVIINGFGEQHPKTWRLSYILCRNKIPVIGIHNKSGLLGSLSSVSKSVENINSTTGKYIKKGVFAIYLLMLKIGLQSRYDTYFVSGKIPSLNITKYSSKFVEVVEIHNRTYDEFLKFGTNSDNRDYIVFLDVAMPFIVDFIEWGLAPLDAEAYYKQINIFFNKLESITGKKVVICAHPQFSVNKKDIYFPDREVVWFKTNEYIAGASLVIAHFTNAIQYAVLHKKKILLLDDDNFNPYISASIDFCVESIGLKKINYPNTSEYDLSGVVENIKVDTRKYDEFVSNYLVKKGEKNNSEGIILEVLKRKYSII
jgi:hypothetical protein